MNFVTISVLNLLNPFNKAFLNSSGLVGEFKFFNSVFKFFQRIKEIGKSGFFICSFSEVMMSATFISTSVLTSSSRIIMNFFTQSCTYSTKAFFPISCGAAAVPSTTSTCCTTANCSLDNTASKDKLFFSNKAVKAALFACS